MAYSRGRFVIHYKDGTTYIEDRNDPNAWHNRPKKPIKAIGIQPDPKIYINQVVKDPITDEETKKRITVNLESTDPNVKFIMEEIVLKGSFKYNYGFFIDMHADIDWAKVTKKGLIPIEGSSSNTWGIRMGVVVDNQGHCFCLEYVGTGSPRGYYTTVHSLGMDQHSLIHNYDIKLEELPDPYDNIAPFPEIDPLKIKRKKEKTG